MHIPHLNSILGLFLTANPFIYLKSDSITCFVFYLFLDNVLLSLHIFNGYLCEYWCSIMICKNVNGAYTNAYIKFSFYCQNFHLCIVSGMKICVYVGIRKCCELEFFTAVCVYAEYCLLGCDAT